MSEEVSSENKAEQIQAVQPNVKTAEEQARELLIVVEKYSKELNGRYKELKTQLNEFLELNKEEINELNEIKKEIIELLTEKEEQKVHNMAAEALQNEFLKRPDVENPAEQRETDREPGALDVVIEKMKLGQEMSPEEIKTTTSILDRRDWGDVYNNLKAGDVVVNFSVPSDKFLAIKHLNDVVFGPGHVDELLIAGRNILKEQFKRVLKSKLPSLEDAQLDDLVLSQDYKNSLIKIDKATAKKLAESGIKIDDIIAETSAGVDEFMAGKDGYIYELLDQYAQTKEGKAKKDVLHQFLQDFEKISFGYRLNSGSSEIRSTDGENASYKDIATSVSESTVLSRIMELDKLADSMGLKDYKIFDNQEMSYESAVLKSIENFSRLGKEIMSTNILLTQEGEEYKIFEIKNGLRVFNKELLRDVRKDKLHAQDAALFDKITLYYKMLNQMDFVKPHTKEEIEGKKLQDGSTLEEKLSIFKKASADLKENGKVVSEEQRKNVARVLRTSEKSELYTSDSEFKARALAIDDCTILSIDLLDVGVDQLLNYEKLLQEVENLPEEKRLQAFQENVLKASDQLTERLREFRNNVAGLKKVKEAKMAGGADLFLGKVGGDELTLALPSSMVDDELLFAVKSVLPGTGARIVSSKVVRGSEKDRSTEHDEALKKAEAGIDCSKKIEEVVRKLNKGFDQRLVTEITSSETDDFLNVLLSAEQNSFVSNFTINEDKNGGFKVVAQREGVLAEEAFESVMKKLSKLQEKYVNIDKKMRETKKRKLKVA